MALVLSFNFGIFGGNVYAGDGDPLVEHEKEGLITKYVKEEQKYTKIYDLSKTSRAISYRRKEDFFSYDELRAITIHNVYSAFDENEGIIPSYLKTIKALGDIIFNISYEMAEGKYKIRGETKDDVLKNVLAVRIICKTYNKVKTSPTINRKTTFLFNFQGSNPFIYGIY